MRLLRLINATPATSGLRTIVCHDAIKSRSDVFAPLVTWQAALCRSWQRIPACNKTVAVTPPLEKKGLDRDDAANYRPIFNLFTISTDDTSTSLTAWLDPVHRPTGQLQCSEIFDRTKAALRQFLEAVPCVTLHQLSLLWTLHERCRLMLSIQRRRLLFSSDTFKLINFGNSR